MSDHRLHRAATDTQRFRKTGCLEEEGDAEAHQSQPCQTGGSEKRKGLNHRQLQH
jgi:hypothetical protein